MKPRLCVLCVFAVICFVANAQYDIRSHFISIDSLSSAEKTVLQERALNKLEEFRFYLNKIANHKLPYDKRQNAIMVALDLFAGKGQGYYIATGGGKKLKQAPAKVFMKIEAGTKTQTLTVKKFLWNLNKEAVDVNLKIVVDSASIVCLEPVEKQLSASKVKHLPMQIFNKENSRGTKLLVNKIETPFDTTYDAKFGDVYISLIKKQIVPDWAHPK